MSKITISIVALLVAAAIVGAYFYPGSTVVQLAGSPAGTTFNTAKVAAINYSPATAAASSTSILNTDTSTRILTDEFVSCTGANGQGATFTMATTTLANLGSQGNNNSAATVIATTTTTSQNMYSASSTEGAITYVSRLWPSGTYLTITASAVNSGSCNVGAHYLGT